MKVKKKYCLNMSSYKYKSGGYKQLISPIILKESNNLNINIENLIPTQNKCPSGKNCPNYKKIFELKQEIVKLIDKISQLKKIAEYSNPNLGKSKISKSEIQITPEKDTEKNNFIYNQLINSFRNSSKNKLLQKKIKFYNIFLFKNNILNSDKIKLRPNSTKNLEIKESFDKMNFKEKLKINEKKNKEKDNEKDKEKDNEKDKEKNNEKDKGKEKEKDKDKEKEKDKEKDKQKDKEIDKQKDKENKIINFRNINKKINMNFFSSSSRKRNENSLRNKKINNNQRYETEYLENKSYSRNLKVYAHDSFSSLNKTKINELSSLNLHLSNSIISPAVKITPKNLFDSIKSSKNL